MKKLLHTSFNQAYLDIYLLILRLGVAGFMLTHGVPKLFKLFAGGAIKFADPIGLGPATSLSLTVFSEFLCSILIAFGLGTRLATIPLIITMLVAAFIAHGDDPFGQKEKALLFMLIYGTLLVLGAGKYSLDYLLTRKEK